MKVMLKKAVTMVCILILIIAIAASCDSTEEQLFDDEMFNDLQEADVTFCFPGTEHPDMKMIMEEMEYRVDELKINLNYEFIPWPNYLSGIDAMLASDSVCDAFYYSDNIEGRSWLEEQVYNNNIMDITGLFMTYAPNYYAKFSEEEFKAASIGGKLCAIPNRMPHSNIRSALVRSDLIEKYNIQPIKNYDDLETYLEIICKNEPELFPLSIWDTTIGLFAEFYGYVIFDYELGLVYKWDDTEMKLMAWEQTSEFREAITRVFNWYVRGYLKKNVGLVRPDETVVTSGKWTCIISGLGASHEYNMGVYSSGKTDWVYVEYPLCPEDVISARTSPMDRAIVFSANSKNPERTMMFINAVESAQEYYDLFMYGIEDENYVLKDGQLFLPEGAPLQKMFTGWSGSGGFENIDFQRGAAANTSLPIEEYREIIDKFTRYVPHTGFIPDYSQIQAIAPLRRIYYYTLDRKMNSGSFSPDDIDDYVAQEKKSADNLVAAIQKQLDEWKNN